MKYIRTETGIIAFGKEYAYPTRVVKGNQHYIYTELTESTFEKMKDFNKWNIIAQADTIEELCDEFVLYDNQFKTYGVFDKKVITFKWLQTHLNIYKGMTIYGAIWTPKGLIYVAKMNEKGELELI